MGSFPLSSKRLLDFPNRVDAMLGVSADFSDTSTGFQS
jgi:hypothetical protein